MASRSGMNAAGMRQRPIAAWEAEGTTCSYTFNPGTLPPGAQSLGESESVVSHTSPRISEGAAAHLARLFQIIWTENCTEEARSTTSDDNLSAPDIDMRDRSDNTSEGTAMSVDRDGEHAQPNARESAGMHSGEQGGAVTPPDTNVRPIGNATHSPSHSGGEAQASEDNNRPEPHPDDSVPRTQDNNFLCEDCHSAGGSQGNNHATSGTSGGQDHDDTQRTMANTTEGEHLCGDEVISPTIPFTHPDLQSTDGDVSANQTVNLQTTRRPLTGVRVAPMSRRMRTVAPPQHEKQTETSVATWGLGPCSANDRWNICDRYIRENDTRGTRAGLHSALSHAGRPDNIAEIAIGTWLQAGLLIDSGEHNKAGAADNRGNFRILEPPGWLDEHSQSETQLVALLSLFDGMGLARIAIDEAIHDCGRITLARSAFVEHDRTLARQVAAVWNSEVSHGRARVPHTPIACDIWDLCRPEHSPLGATANGNPTQADFITPLSRFAQSVPTGCATIIVAGPPCQQFTFAGRYRGQQGLCGPDLVLFFAVPTVAWILQELRPDTIVHVVLENAASMQAMHRKAIMQALGGLSANEHLRILDSGAWSAFPRRRRFFMTIPGCENIILPARRDAPWEPGWGPIPSPVLYPIICSRDNTNLRTSTIQYHAQSLAYRYAENGSEFDWHARPEQHVRAEIIRTMPSEVRVLYRMLLRGHTTNAEESRMGPVIDRIHQEGPRLGSRVPNPSERARATGRAQYPNEFGLNDVQLYSAVGNHFDPDALRARIRGPLFRVTRSGAALRHLYPTAADLSVMYQLVARGCEQRPPSCPVSVPFDLVRILTATRRSGGTTDHAQPRPAEQQIAAEHGCQDQ